MTQYPEQKKSTIQDCDRTLIHVTCAIIEKDGHVLAAQRGPAMETPSKWEFPGGKIEPHESPEECLRRELLEELDVEIVILRSLDPTIHSYPAFTIMLYPFVCAIAKGKIKLNEHAAIKWMPARNLHSLDWAEADLPVLAAYCQLLEKIKSKGSL